MPNPRVREVFNRLRYRPIGHSHKPFTDAMVKRVREPVVSTQSIDFEAPHSAKSKQAWRYPGNRIIRAPTTRLDPTSDRKYEDHKDPGQARRKQESNFFLTINSNKAPETPETQRAVNSAMQKMLERLSQEHNLAACMKFGPKNPEVYGEDKYSAVVHSLDWKAAVETGPLMGRVHAHIWLTVTHYSQVQINVQAMMHRARLLYNEELNLMCNGHPPAGLRITALPHVHVKLLPQGNWTEIMRSYIHKGMQADGGPGLEL